MKRSATRAPLSSEEKVSLLDTLRTRFDRNASRHAGLRWNDVETRLVSATPEKLAALAAMERTGGEPDVVARDERTGEIVFFDCSAESPKGRVALCYDREGFESRKEHRPAGNAIDLATEIGVELLTEDDYFALQKHGAFDTKTSSWLKTPPELRKLGGALFGDRRYGRVFVYHNGAQSYYGARGFRASLRV